MTAPGEPKRLLVVGGQRRYYVDACVQRHLDPMKQVHFTRDEQLNGLRVTDFEVIDGYDPDTITQAEVRRRFDLWVTLHTRATP